MTFADLLQRFQGLSALVVGDLMLDEYIFGKASRISPEAPVMVVRQESTRAVPGGAANVARNLQALGARTSVVGIVGSDEAGDRLEKALSDAGSSTPFLIREASRATTRKTRILADHAHQVLRIDHEDDGPVSAEAENKLIDKIREQATGCDVVLLSDYLKGTLTSTVSAEAIGTARAAGVPVVVNPKPRSLHQYSGSTLVSLNRSEATEALDRWKVLSDEEAAAAAEVLRVKVGVDAIMLTLGESGLQVAAGESFRVTAPKVEVYDTAGAGDTVAATVALGVAAIGMDRMVFELAALTSAAVVRKVGVATPSEEDLAQIRGL